MNRQVPVVDDLLVIDIVWGSMTAARSRGFVRGPRTLVSGRTRGEDVPQTRGPSVHFLSVGKTFRILPQFP